MSQSGELCLPHKAQAGREKKELSSCLLYTEHHLPEVTASLVLQSAVTAASSQSRVTVVVGGSKWSEMPQLWHLMPQLSPAVMKSISFLYPRDSKVRGPLTSRQYSHVSHFKDLTKHFIELSSKDKNNLPNTIIVSDLDTLVEKSSGREDRDFLLGFIRLSAILVDFSHYFAKQNQTPSTLLVLSKLPSAKAKVLSNRQQEFYSEFWRVESDKISCQSSKNKMIVNFSKKDNEYFLDNLQY